MAYTQEQIEYLHNIGKMPDWIYYQQNNKSPQQNIDEQGKKAAEKFRNKRQEKMFITYIDKYIREVIDDFSKELIDNKKLSSSFNIII